MTQPCQHLRDRGHDATRRQGWSVDHNNRHAQRAGGVEFGRSPRAACVFGDDMGDFVAAQQGGIACDIKGAARDNDGGIRQGLACGRIDQPQQVMVLRLGGEGIKGLLSNRQEYPRRRVGQGGNRACDIRHMDPVIAAGDLPRRALQGQQLHTAGKAGINRVPAHLRGKGVGCIDNMGDTVGAQVIAQTRHAAKTADAGGQGLGHGVCGATRIGKHGVYALCCKGGGKLTCLSGSAQEEGAHG